MKKPLILVALGLLLATFTLAQMPVQITAGPAGTNGRMVPAHNNGRIPPITRNGRLPGDSNPRMRPVDIPPASRNGRLPSDSNPRMRPGG